MGKDYANLKHQSFAGRIFKLKMEAKLRLQFCAILSQLHRHKEAFEQAQEGIKVAHLVVRDKISVCRYYSRRIDLKANEPPDSTNQSVSRSEATGGKSRAQSKSKKKKRDGSMAGNNNEIDQQSKSSFPFDDEDEQEFSKQYPPSGSGAAHNDFDVISDTASAG